MLMDQVGQGEAAVDYATGALVNAQVSASLGLRLPSQQACLPACLPACEICKGCIGPALHCMA